VRKWFRQRMRVILLSIVPKAQPLGVSCLAAGMIALSSGGGVVHAQEERAVTLQGGPRSSTLSGELHEETAILYQLLETSLQEITTLGQRNLNLLQVVSEAVQARQDLQHHVASLAKANAAVETQVKELRRAHQRRLRELEAQLASLRETLQEERATAAAHRSDVEQLTRAKTALEAEVQELTLLQHESAQLQTELAAVRKLLREEQMKGVSQKVGCRGSDGSTPPWRERRRSRGE